MTGGTDRVVGLGYHEKGWPTFEYALAMMIKVANTSRLADWPQVLDLGKTGDAQFKLTRPAPAEPLAFFGGHVYGEKRYTNGADRDAIVAPKCVTSLPGRSACMAWADSVLWPLLQVSRDHVRAAGWGDRAQLQQA